MQLSRGHFEGAHSPRRPRSARGRPWPEQWTQRAPLLPSSPAARRWLRRPPAPAGRGTSGKALAGCCSSGRWSSCTVGAKGVRWEALGQPWGLSKSNSIFSPGCFWWGESKAGVQNGACFWWENYYRYTFMPRSLWVLKYFITSNLKYTLLFWGQCFDTLRFISWSTSSQRGSLSDTSCFHMGS